MIVEFHPAASAEFDYYTDPYEGVVPDLGWRFIREFVFRATLSSRRSCQTLGIGCGGHTMAIPSRHEDSSLGPRRGIPGWGASGRTVTHVAQPTIRGRPIGLFKRARRGRRNSQLEYDLLFREFQTRPRIYSLTASPIVE